VHDGPLTEIAKARAERDWKPMPNPTAVDLKDPLFEAIWRATKSWDVSVPESYCGYCGMNGSHVMVILNAVHAVMAARIHELAAEVREGKPDGKAKTT